MRKNLVAKPIILVLLTAIISLSTLALTACGSGAETPLNHYKISAVYDEQNGSVSADMNLSYVNATDTTLGEVCMHLYPSAFRQDARFFATPKDKFDLVYPKGISYGGIEIKSVSLNGKKANFSITGDDENILAVKLDSELFPDERVEIGVEFVSTLPTAKHRFGRYNGIANLGNWYPVACVYDDGGFNTEPYYDLGDPFYSDCADYEVKIAVNKSLVVAGSSAGVRRESNNLAEYIFTGKKLRDFALCIGEFNCLKTVADGVEINYFYPKNNELERDKTALNTAVDAIKTYCQLFGKYPYKTYSVVRTEFFHGGMEYAGLSLLSSDLNPSLFTDALIHETAHQWWYGVVGNDQVNHAWLDESLTEYSTGLFYEKNARYGVDSNKRLADSLASYIVYFDKTLPAKKCDIMNRSLAQFNGETEYAFCSYVKGQLMLTDLRKIVGDERFFLSLKNYYSAYAYKTATPDDLIGIFEKTCAKPLKDYFYSWLDGKAQSFA